MAPRLAYVTDVEGMWSRLASFATENPLVRLDDQERLELADDVTFVFGGDAIDRGPAGHRILTALVDAKQRYRDRVILLAGNRDLNKLRLWRELSGHPPRKAPEQLRGDRPQLLRWILTHTMGARDAFDHRRAELPGASDDEVAQTFLDDLAEGGLLRAYLAGAQLAYRSGATLFVHGAVTDDNLGVVPFRSDRLAAGDWPDALNRFYAEQFARFCAGDADAAGEAAWSPLIAYQAPAPGQRTNPASVVYARTCDEHNNMFLPGARTVHALRDAGIHRVVVGHTPNGDSPTIVRARGFELVCADNSHARVPDGARVTLSDASLEVAAATRLDDDRREDVRFTLHAADDDSPIGRRTRDGLLVKGRLADGRWLLFRMHPDYRVEQRAVTDLPGLEPLGDPS